MSVQFGLEHPVPVASSCCWPQPSPFSWRSENCPGGICCDRTSESLEAWIFHLIAAARLPGPLVHP
ncbi:hypothetical protein MC885_006600 [Smutsia gigantea]|nr:hypothetical protein MC885_006600 [Smutsia gigantea]